MKSSQHSLFDFSLLNNRFVYQEYLRMDGSVTSGEKWKKEGIKSLAELKETIPTTSTKRVEEVELAGDPGVGTVLWIRQFHKRPEFGKKQMEAVGEYQLEILKELMTQKPKHVFDESLYEDYSAKDNSMMEKAVKLIFNGNNNSLKKETLADFGATMVYACLNEDVTVHKTLTKEESDKIDSSIERKDKNFGELVMYEREKLATREVKKFLDQNKGEKIALIYGGGHTFKDDFESDKPPLLISINFPEKYPIEKPVTVMGLGITTGIQF